MNTLVIDASTDYESESGFETGIRWFSGGCDRTIQSEFLFDQNHEIWGAINVKMKESSASGKTVGEKMGDR